MTETTLHWLVGLTGGTLLALMSGIVTLVVLAFRAGRVYGAIEEGKKKLEDAIGDLKGIRSDLQKLSLHDQRLGQLERVYEKLASDIRELLRGPPRPSSPNFHQE